MRRGYPLGGAAAAIGIVLLMIGCGGDVEQAGVSLAPPPSATAYVVVDPPTTTTTVPPTQPPVAATSPGAGGVPPPANPTEYVVRENDSVFAIASRFGLTPEELAAINGWPDGIGQTILPGDTIRIAAPTASDPSTDPSADPATDPAPSGGECPTTYTIQAGDTTRIAVADRFGITFEEMDAANANTPGYSSFVVGTPITIPCPS